MTTEHERLRNKYHLIRNYRHKRQQEPWEMTSDEWMAFFTKSPALMDRLLKPRGSAALNRKDPLLPWSVNNMTFDSSISATRRYSKRAGGALLGEETLLERFNSYGFTETDEPARTLTVAEWRAEVRNQDK